ncbi:MAG TPA: DUF4102 domain-containing protein, partial [Porticoccus sp.]|nr:DUF4102 domain-containing protein [Porticoccus sp.]
MNLTDATLRKWLLSDRKKNESLKCNKIGGFHIRVNQDSPKGDIAPASYRVKFRVNGVFQRTPTIGKYGEIKLAKARAQAGLLKAQAKSGIDKVEE